MPRKSIGIKVPSVKSPAKVASFIVDDFKNSEFLTKWSAHAWLKKRIEKELTERDALLLGDVTEALGGTC